MRRPLRGGVALLLLAVACMAQAAPRVEVSLRDTGYTLGDTLTSHASWALPEGQRLDPASLPVPGRVTSWLDLVAVNERVEGGIQHVDFLWQVFATVETARQLHLPAVEVRMLGHGASLVRIPAQSFHLSPVLPHPLQDTRPRGNLRPVPMDARTPLLQASGWAALAVACGIAWLWLIDRLPGLPRHPGPLTRQARCLRDYRAERLDEPSLRSIHAALNAAAGETLYPDTLPRLFVRAPHLAAERGAIEAFFRQSWNVFYGQNAVPPTVAETRAWVSRAALLERMR